MSGGPPAPPPPPAVSAAPASAPASSGGASLLDALQKKGLKHTETVDRSAPRKQGAIVDSSKQYVLQLKPEESVPRERCAEATITEMYNLIQDSGRSKRVFDCRSSDAYGRSHAKTAVHLCDLAELDAEKLDAEWLAALAAEHSTLRQRGLVYRHALLYGDDGDGDKLRRIAELLAADTGSRALEQVLTVPHGYARFADEFACMCVQAGVENKRREYPTCVVERLFLGNSEHAHSAEVLRDLRITHIVNMAAELENKFADELGIRYANAHADDHSEHDLRERLRELLDFTRDALAEPDARVLVHCAMGISRAPTLVIAHIMRTQRVPFDEAKLIVKRQRSIIEPNAGFCEQLRLMQDELLGDK